MPQERAGRTHAACALDGVVIASEAAIAIEEPAAVQSSRYGFAPQRTA
jgi:hypothetical protein